MGIISSKLLWLEASFEMHGEVFYLERLHKPFVFNSLPLWQQILIEGSHEQIKQLLMQLQLLEKENRLEAFHLLSPRYATLADHIAAYANAECLTILFSMLKDFSDEEQHEFLLYEHSSCETSFLECLSKNKAGSLALEPFFNYIQTMSLVNRVNLFKKTSPSGCSFPSLLAYHQTSFLDNGFVAFIKSWEILQADFNADNPMLTNKQLCIEVFGNKKKIKAFCNDVCRYQSKPVLFELLDNNLIPVVYLHYFRAC